MTQPMTLTIFGVPTARGIDLIQRATALGQRLGYTVSVADPVNQWALVCAAFSSDIVLFDGTIEDEQQHIYHAGALIPADLPRRGEAALGARRHGRHLEKRSRSVPGEEDLAIPFNGYIK